VRLASHLYAEQLLDREHYIDWIITQLESCNLERLPIWLLLAQVYWKDLVAERRHGRRVAESLLAQVATVSSQNSSRLSSLTQQLVQATAQGCNQLLTPVIHRLHQLIVTLAVSHRGCMLLPKTWNAYKQVMQDLPNNYRNPVLMASMKNIEARNERIASAGTKSSHAQKSSRWNLLALLDSVHQEIHLEILSSKCIALLADTQELVDTVFHWATSVYREGHHRIYLAARLLRKWNRMGMDTDGAILALLPRIHLSRNVEQQNVYRIITELVSSKHFSVGRYLQWLIASGSLALCRHPGQVSRQQPCCY